VTVAHIHYPAQDPPPGEEEGKEGKEGKEERRKKSVCVSK
jgi:hypothetical protein